MHSSLISIVFILSACFSLQSYALSCSQMHDRVIATCNSGDCQVELYVKEVSAHLTCSRRPTIESVPDWAKGVIEFEIFNRGLSESSAIYELILESRYWSSKNEFSDLSEYILLANDEVRGKFFQRKLNVIDDETVSEITNNWGSKAREEYLINLLWNIGDWLSLAISVVALVFSILWYNKWIIKNNSIRWLFASFLVQSIIMSLVAFSLMGWDGFLISLMGLIIPGVWLYELVFYFTKMVERKSRLIG